MIFDIIVRATARISLILGRTVSDASAQILNRSSALASGLRDRIFTSETSAKETAASRYSFIEPLKG